MYKDFTDLSVLVVGDLMVDNYLFGSSSRMSPEAFVPVVIPEKEVIIPGGAANVAMNLRSLGANVECIGAVGDDVWGKKLISILNKNGIYTKGIKILKNSPTTLKQRIYCNGKQVARIDKEKLINFNLDLSAKNIKKYDVCIISDYNKGAINKKVVSNINIYSNILIVDPKKNNFSVYKNANIITPNFDELQKASKIKIKNNKSIIGVCTDFIKLYGFEYIVLKRGSDGMTIVGQNNFVKHIKGHNVSNPDVTGAGDTVISALSLLYAKTHDIEIAANFANDAAATAVSKTGTATVTIDEINNYIKSKL